MAWNARWTLSFDSRTGKQCVVTISEQDWVGNVTALTGGAVPFETQEDDDDDIFMPIRGQSGYIRIVSDDATLIDNICPDNNLQHLVTLTVDGAIRWRGFQTTDIYEQEWRGGVREIELPVRSLLASLDCTELTGNRRWGKHKIGALFYDIFATFGIDTLTFRTVWSMLYPSYFFGVYIYSDIFFGDSSENGELQDDKKYSETGDVVIGELCKVCGITLRESRGEIYICQHGRLPYMVSEVIHLNSIKNGTNESVVYYNVKYPELSELITTWRGNDNSETRLPACRKVAIELEINKEDNSEDILSLDDIEVDDVHPVYDASIWGGTLHVQPYPPTVAEEMYGDRNPWTRGYVYDYHNPAKALPVQSGSAYSYIVANNAPWRERWSGSDIAGTADNAKTMHAGAFPCRWSFDTSTADMTDISATDGYYLALIPILSNRITEVTSYPVFHYNTDTSKQFDGGYIGIDFHLLTLFEGWFEVSNMSYWHDYNSVRIDMDTIVGIYISIKVGDLYWNGTSWTSQAMTFPINIENGVVKGNWESTMDIDNTSGYLIPLNSITAGAVEIQINNYALMTVKDEDDMQLPIGRAFLMSNFSIKYHKPSSKTSLLSDRSSNIYTAMTDGRGFAAVEKIDLKVGTNNANRPSHSFLISVYGDYLKDFPYIYDVDMSAFNMLRPEQELLQRLKKFYNAPKKKYTLKIEQTPIYTSEREIGLPEIYPRINSRTYLAIESNNDWREDTQQFILIEMY